MDKYVLVSTREEILKKLGNLFIDSAIEAHVFGSVARGDADFYSDIDIWFTFKDEEYEEVYKNRFENYRRLGTLIHSCEAPQNAPINGVHTAMLIKTVEVISVVDIYLCPLASAYKIKDGKKLFGIDLPVGETTFNSKKVAVDKNYRIDFFICFIFNTIKKLARNEKDPLEGVIREYENLYKNYNISISPLDNTEQNFNTLENIIENTKKIANEKQKEALFIIHNFAQKLLF
ncbi:MAG: nucleotidyltransferase domain-containing protein [Candidatus Pacebacteria bacterium]|nr:nucleotidyltransferase domain-containing protein [Candidatus Paceibacterota bacterium]